MAKLKSTEFEKSIKKKHAEFTGRGNTTYQESYPSELIYCYMQGGTIDTFCSERKIPTRTFYGWFKDYPDLFDAYDIAMAAGKARLNKAIEDNLDTEFYNHYGADKLYSRRFAQTFLMLRRFNRKLSWSENARMTIEEMANCQLSVEITGKVLFNLSKAAEICEREELIPRLEYLEKRLAELEAA